MIYVLLKDISGSSAYTAEEKRLCEALKEGPLMLEELAERLQGDIYTLPADRLEEEGVIIRSGLTPTDMMVVKGDYPVYEPEAAIVRMMFENYLSGQSTSETPGISTAAASKPKLGNPPGAPPRWHTSLEMSGIAAIANIRKPTATPQSPSNSSEIEVRRICSTPP